MRSRRALTAIGIAILLGLALPGSGLFIAPERASAATSSVVVIDAGHQSHGDSRLEPIGPGSKTMKPRVAVGTSGIATHIRESTINLRVAVRLRRLLEAAGVKVIMIRTISQVNVSNSRRAIIANNAHADLFIRIHCDGADRSLHGFLTLVPARNRWTVPILAPSLRAGRAIHAAALTATEAVDRGIVRRGDMTGFNWSRVPGVIVEIGNMRNRTEDRRLATPAYQQKVASGVAAGVLSYLAAE